MSAAMTTVLTGRYTSQKLTLQIVKYLEDRLKRDGSGSDSEWGATSGCGCGHGTLQIVAAVPRDNIRLDLFAD